MKNNLKLSLDALQVESFSTTDSAEEMRGTVRAHISGQGCPADTEMLCSGDHTCQALCSAYCPQQTNPCTLLFLTCPQPSAKTCDATCGCPYPNPTQAITCYVSCDGTCEFATQCW